jgi:hypothetical protein
LINAHQIVTEFFPDYVPICHFLISILNAYLYNKIYNDIYSKKYERNQTMSMSIPTYRPRKSEITRKVIYEQDLKYKMCMVYLNSVVLSDFRPNRIKVPIDEFRQKAERNSSM